MPPWPTAALAGVTAIDTSAADDTVNAVLPLTPPKAALMVAVPTATVVATPVAATVAVALLELLHVACEVMLRLDPSL